MNGKRGVHCSKEKWGGKVIEETLSTVKVKVVLAWRWEDSVIENVREVPGTIRGLENPSGGTLGKKTGLQRL